MRQPELWYTDRTCESVTDGLGGVLEFCTISFDWFAVGLFSVSVLVASFVVMHMLLNMVFGKD